MSRKRYPLLSLLLCLLASPLWVLAQAEVEPNNTRATANRIAAEATVTGGVACGTNPTDPDDYFVTTLPDDGTVRVYVEYTNASGSAGSDVALYAYDEIGNQISFVSTPNVALGAAKLDTMTVYCRAKEGDLSFRVNANGCFNYKLRYEVLPPPYATDAEPNATRATAKPIVADIALTGRIAYVNGQNQRDVDDYFVTTLPDDGTLRATIEYLNTSNDAGSDVALYVYDEIGNQIGFESTPNVALGGTVTATLNVFCRAKSQLFFRINANGCFGYRLKYEMLVPPYAADAEPNGTRQTAKPIVANTALTGRIGYVSDRNQRDGDDYFVTTLPDDGTVRATIEYLNTSNDAGSDAGLYVYDEIGNQLDFLSTPNVPLGAPVTVSTDVFCRAKSQLYFRVNANGCFGYKLKYETLVPPYAADAEPNGTRETAQPIVANTALTGRIGYVDGRNQRDVDDFFVTAVPDDGTVRVFVEYLNISNTDGSDVALYAYDKIGNQIGFTSTPNVALGAAKLDTMSIYCRARDTLYFRINANGCFGYRLRYEVLPPPYAADAEPNGTTALAKPIAHGVALEGRIGYVNGQNQRDANDYFVTALPNDGTVRAYVEYLNSSNDAGSDVALYAYDEIGNQIGFVSTPNVALGAPKLDTMTLYCRARDTLYFRINANGCFGYRLRYELIPSPYAADQEPNDTRPTATPISLATPLEGRIGYVDGRNASDGNDYFTWTRTGATNVRMTVEYVNVSNNTGTDAGVYVYDAIGNQVFFASLANLPLGYGRTVLNANCLPAGALALRINANGCVAYKISFQEESAQPEARIEFARYGNDFAFAANELKADKLTWTFGDGTTSTMRLPTHTFAIGTYDVKLRAENTACRLVAERTLRVVVDGIESYSPKRAEMAEPFGRFDLRIFGAGLSATSEVTLTKGGLVLRPVQRLSPSTKELTTFFEFDDAEVGVYDLSVKLASGQTITFPRGFEIRQGRAGFDIQVEAVGPSRIRTNRWTDFKLNVTNDRGRVANGVAVGVVLPKGVETNLGDFMRRRTGTFTIKGDDWDRLELNREDFDEFFFGGEFDPRVDTVSVDFDALNAAYGPRRAIDIDTLYEEPFAGELYLLYLPVVLAESTTEYHFKVRSPVSQDMQIVTYAWPEPFRNNPLDGKQLDQIKQGALDLAAVLGTTPIPAFNRLGKVVGYWDIGTQVLSAEAVDAWYGTNTADAEAYQKWGVDLAFEFGGSKLPAGKNLENNAAAARRGKQQIARTTKRIGKNQNLLAKTGKGRIRKSERARLQRRLAEMQAELDGLGEFATEADRQAVLDFAKKIATNKGLNLAKTELKDDVFGEDPSANCSTEPKEIKRKPVTALTSFDPNAIYGNAGVGAARYVRRAEALGYEITFENVDTAEAAAQIVRVTTVLDPAVYDLSRTTLGDVAFGGKTYKMEGQRTEFFQDIDLRPAQALIVRVSAKLDTTSGRFDWQFTSLDPVTMDLTQDVDAGFLPPNKSTPEGEGGVYFTTYLLPTAGTNDSLGAQALIYFDENVPIATNVWSNVVDETAPTSRLSPAATMVNDSTVAITYTGADVGSGVEDIYLHSRREGEEWSMAVYPLLPGGTSEIVLNADVTYSFYVTARDAAGNEERKAPAAELTVRNGTVGLEYPPAIASALRLFPNPSPDGQVSLRSTEDMPGAAVTVFDALGRQTYSTRLDLVEGGTVGLDLGHLPAGTYQVRVINAEQQAATLPLVLRP